MAASTDQLHTHAIKGEEHAEALATGLAQVGADDAAVKAVTQCAGILRKIGAALAKGGTADEPAEEQPPRRPTMDDAMERMPSQQRPQ